MFFILNKKKIFHKKYPLNSMERIIGIEPTSSPWQGDIIAIIRYPRFIATFILHNYYIKIENNSQVIST